MVIMVKKRTKSRSKTKAAKPKTASKNCICGSECYDKHANLPGYILIALGLVAIPLNLGMMGGFDLAKAWPLLFVLFGFVLLAKVQLCRHKSR